MSVVGEKRGQNGTGVYLGKLYYGDEAQKKKKVEKRS